MFMRENALSVVNNLNQAFLSAIFITVFLQEHCGWTKSLHLFCWNYV